MNAYLLSHTDLGDNLFMIGALRFLLNFYDKIYFLCKNNNYANTSLFFIDTPRIICIPFDRNNEIEEPKSIIMQNYHNNDIFICGYYPKQFLKSKITNTDFLNYPKINNNDTIEFDTLTNENYHFIEDFYNDALLNLTYFYDYFYLPTTDESIEIYNSIKNYYIIFIQTLSSHSSTPEFNRTTTPPFGGSIVLQTSCSKGQILNIDNLIEKYINDNNVLLICSDKNIYENKSEEKYNLCQPFVYNKVIHYTETIKNSDEIYIIESCFTGIVLPYLKRNKLKTDKVRIIYRKNAHEGILLF